ncbi:MAG: proteasome accessory factor PafA2 family protein [Vicinamibacterales bacterium]
MARTLMGGETEFAIALPRPGEEQPPEQRPLLEAIMAFARQTLPLTSLAPNGRFLTNGGLLYLDCGLHLEWSTPECATPHDVVRYLRAGDLIVSRLVAAYAAQAMPDADVFVSRCNIDYEAGTAWASHESYLARERNSEVLAANMVPFLVSRLVMCGAGGWEYQHPGLVFTLSPRTRFISRTTGADAQFSRSIFQTKDERLSTAGTRRLHLSCSETLCSTLGTWLRFGTTALVLAAIEAGERPGDATALHSPLAAMLRFAADPTCSERVPLIGGSGATAVDIQRQYLRCVERHVGTPAMPDWAPDVVRVWRSTLDDLEADSTRVNVVLDWAIKRAVFERFLVSRGFDGPGMRRWNTFLKRRRRLHPDSPEFRSALREAGFDDDQFAAFMQIRRQLLELDMRFGQIGPDGIFESLDASGALRHDVPGVCHVESAVTEPPQGTRAALRGAVIRRLSGLHTRYRADWIGVTDLDARATLDLGDPFQDREHWHPMPSHQSG